MSDEKKSNYVVTVPRIAGIDNCVRGSVVELTEEQAKSAFWNSRVTAETVVSRPKAEEKSQATGKKQ